MHYEVYYIRQHEVTEAYNIRFQSQFKLSEKKKKVKQRVKQKQIYNSTETKACSREMVWLP